MMSLHSFLLFTRRIRGEGERKKKKKREKEKLRVMTSDKIK